MFELNEILLLVVPLVLLHYGLAVYCIVDILRNGPKNLNRTAWILLVLLFQFFGSVAYLLAGRKGSANDQGSGDP
ncbi:MAG TPA: hypothetical protein DD727_04250 [Clostridiales bacterium]|nr:hypothetical protein [Clostridiales bacterium]